MLVACLSLNESALKNCPHLFLELLSYSPARPLAGQLFLYIVIRALAVSLGGPFLSPFWEHNSLRLDKHCGSRLLLERTSMTAALLLHFSTNRRKTNISIHIKNYETRKFTRIFLTWPINVNESDSGETNLSFKIYSSRAQQVTFVVSLLHRRRGFGTHHPPRR